MFYWYFAVFSVSYFLFMLMIYIKRRTLTREGLAFYFHILYSVLGITVVTNIFGYNIPIRCYNEINKYFFGSSPIPEPELTNISVLFIFVLLVVLWLFGLFIFRTIPLKKSISEENGDVLESISTSAIYYILKPSSRKVYRNNNKEEELDELPINNPFDRDTISWHQQAANLLMLRDPQIKINANDWYPNQKCFISKYGKQQEPLVVVCTIDEISEARLTDIVKFSLLQHKCDQAIFYYAIQKNMGTGNMLVSGQKIQIVCEDSLLDDLIDLSEYKNKIVREFTIDDFYQGCGHSLIETYTEPACNVHNVDNNTDFEIESIETYVFDWLNDNSQHKQLAILGDYGQGKSVLCKKIVYRLMTEENLSKRIPILISLSGKSPEQYESAFDILGEWCSRNDIRQKAIIELHRAGRLLIIFDGFDEMKLVGDVQMRKEHFCRLWEFSSEYSKIIITGRPNYFLNNDEMKYLLRLGMSCEALTIQLFDDNRIEKALRFLPSSTQNSILNTYKTQGNKSSFADMLKRPSLLAITGLQWDNISKISDDNLNSAKVIGLYLDSCYERQKVKKSKGHITVLSIEERAYFMWGIALGMLKKSGDYTNLIGKKDLYDIVLKLIQYIPKEVTQLSTQSSKRKISDRYDKRYNNDSVFMDIVSCGVLVRDLGTYDSYRFAHKSFLELLVARYDALITTASIMNENDLRVKIIKSYYKALDLNSSFVAEHQSRDVSAFIIEEIANNIHFSENLSGYDKLKKIYKIIQPLPISFNTNLLFSRIFGIRWLTSFIALLVFVFFFEASIYIALKGIFSNFVDSTSYIPQNISNKSYYAIFILFNFTFWAVIILQRKLRFVKHKQEGIPGYKHEVFDFISQAYLDKIEQILVLVNSFVIPSTSAHKSFDSLEKNGLFYAICKSLGLDGELEKYFSAKNILDMERNLIVFNFK